MVDAANVQLMVCGLWVYLPLVDELKMRKQDYFQRGEDGTFIPLASFLKGRQMASDAVAISVCKLDVDMRLHLEVEGA